jgi:capsular exopolysaccharide synthesis family protein
MSHIFDALQRAEAERSGVELDAFDVPTELLEIAESAVKVQVAEPAPVTQVPGLDLPIAETRSLIGNFAERSSPWEQFESLPVSLPFHSKLVSVMEKDGLAAEKFRFLAVRLRHLQQRRPLKRLLITSTMPEEGKSMVAANLACTLGSRRQQKTLLLDGDLRRPTIQRQLGIGKVPGLTEYLSGTVDARLPIYRLDALGIWVMPAGNVAPNPLELMQAGRLSPLIDKLSTWFDWMVIDSPPILPLADTSVWTRVADGILLVTRQGTTDKEQLKRGLETIEPSKLLGAILNSSRSIAHSDYYQRYGREAISAEHKDSEKQD